jgi:hypothetical protein
MTLRHRHWHLWMWLVLGPVVVIGLIISWNASPLTPGPSAPRGEGGIRRIAP